MYYFYILPAVIANHLVRNEIHLNLNAQKVCYLYATTTYS